MKRSWIAQILEFQVFAIIAIFLQSCGSINATPSPSNCTTGKAVLYIHDTNIQRVCGCQEGGGTFTTGIACTVSVGTTVFFYYPGITIPHHVVMGIGATGAPQFRNPSGQNPSSFVDSVTLNSTGSVSFIDNQTSFGGSFTVQ